MENCVLMNYICKLAQPYVQMGRRFIHFRKQDTLIISVSRPKITVVFSLRMCSECYRTDKYTSQEPYGIVAILVALSGQLKDFNRIQNVFHFCLQLACQIFLLEFCSRYVPKLMRVLM